MNEQIKQLEKDALYFALQFRAGLNGDLTDYETEIIFREKFAELIVGECLNQCYNRGMDDELYTGQLKAATYIEEHFGINTRT